MAKLIVNTEEGPEAIPLQKEPISEGTLNDLTQTEAALGKIINKAGELSINNVTYNIYKSQELQSTEPNTSANLDGYDVTSATNKSTRRLTSYVSPVEFNANELGSLADILKKLAAASHTHSCTNDTTYNETQTGSITPCTNPASGHFVTNRNGQENEFYACGYHNNCSNCEHHGNRCDGGSWW